MTGSKKRGVRCGTEQTPHAVALRLSSSCWSMTIDTTQAATAILRNPQSLENTMDDKVIDRNATTDSLGAHPVGTGVGAVAGGIAGAAVAGAAVGTAVGPVGTVVGAVVGAVAGGLAGHGVAAMIDPSAEDTYWRDNYASRPYVSGATYDDYGPAYRYGVEGYGRYEGRKFDDVESELSRDWQGARGTSTLAWDKAKHATRESWNRVSDAIERAVPGDSDKDGK